MSEASPTRAPLEHATDEFWKGTTINEVLVGIEPWRDDDAGRLDVADDEWAAFIGALAE